MGLGVDLARRTKKIYLEEIGLRAQNTLTILESIFTINWGGGLCEQLMS